MRMRSQFALFMCWLPLLMPIRSVAQCGPHTTDDILNIIAGSDVLAYADMRGDGTFDNVSLTLDAYNYLVPSGYLPNVPTQTMDLATYDSYIATGQSFAAPVVLVTLAVPGLGEIVLFVIGGAAVIYLSYEAGKAIGA